MQILIADDHALLAEIIAECLAKSGPYTVALTASLPGVFDQLARQDFDVILLDLRMPGMHGLASIEEVIRRAGEAKVVLFSGHVDRQFLDDAVALGARGFIPKTLPLQSLDVALRLIRSGQTFIPHSSMPTPDDAGRIDHGLNDRDLFVLRLAADGETNKEIARQLASTEPRVKMVMRGICIKLRARNRAHACMMARERMLI